MNLLIQFNKFCYKNAFICNRLTLPHGKYKVLKSEVTMSLGQNGFSWSIRNIHQGLKNLEKKLFICHFSFRQLFLHICVLSYHLIQNILEILFHICIFSLTILAILLFYFFLTRYFHGIRMFRGLWCFLTD